MMKASYGDKLCNKTIRSGSVISRNRLRSMYAESVQGSTGAQVCNHFKTPLRLSYYGPARYAQALGDSVRASRKSTTTVDFRKPEPYGRLQQRILSVDTQSLDTAITHWVRPRPRRLGKPTATRPHIFGLYQTGGWILIFLKNFQCGLAFEHPLRSYASLERSVCSERKPRESSSQEPPFTAWYP